MESKLSKNQEYVIRAICELRVIKGGSNSMQLEHAWVEEKTCLLKKQDDEKKTGKVARQQWTEPFGDTLTEKTWKAIGKAVRGQLPHNDPIEKEIRACKSADSALVAELKMQLSKFEAKFERTESDKKKQQAEFKEFKDKYYDEQCTDAQYRINLKKIILANNRYVEAAKMDQSTINGLRCEISVLKQHAILVESKLEDEDLKIAAGVESIKRPQIFEPKIAGRDDNLENEELLRMYENAIDISLGALEVVAKEIDTDVTLVFHDFNIDIKKFVADGKIPFRSSRMDNLIFACHGASSEIRVTIYQRLATLTASSPRVVVVSGKGKVEALPVKGRKDQDNQDWFTYLIRSGAFRTRPVNAMSEGYDTVIYRRLDNGQ